MDISIFFRFITQQNDSFLRTLDVIIGQFFIKIVVYYRIRKLRTAVEHIPPDDSRSLPFSNPKTFNKILLCLCLGNLAQERKLFQILCLTSKKAPGSDLPSAQSGMHTVPPFSPSDWMHEAAILHSAGTAIMLFLK